MLGLILISQTQISEEKYSVRIVLKEHAVTLRWKCHNKSRKNAIVMTPARRALRVVSKEP